MFLKKIIMVINVNPRRVRRDIFSRPRRTEDEQDVQNGLAYTPQEMLKMAQAGEPISPLSLQSIEVEEGFENLSFDTPIEYQRGVDIGDCWEAEQRSKSNLKKAKDKGLFNVQNAVE